MECLSLTIVPSGMQAKYSAVFLPVLQDHPEGCSADLIIPEKFSSPSDQTFMLRSAPKRGQSDTSRVRIQGHPLLSSLTEQDVQATIRTAVNRIFGLSISCLTAEVTLL